MITEDIPKGVTGRLVRGNTILIGMITEVNDEDEEFVFLTEEIELTLDSRDWEFHPPVEQPSPGWYSHTEYPVEAGCSPVWVNAEGRAFTFVYSDTDNKPLQFEMELNWDDLVPLEQHDAIS